MVCADCAAGALHGGTPKGTTKTLHGLPTYIAEPPANIQPRGIVVIIADAFGWELINNRILADNYAEKGGYTVLLPDFFGGYNLPHDLLYNIETVMDKNVGILGKVPSTLRALVNAVPFFFFNRLSVSQPRVYDYFRGVRASSSLPVGAAGFCWGGKFVTLLCHGTEKTEAGVPLLDAGYVAHPSMLAIPADLKPIALPYSVAHGTADTNIASEMDKFREAIEGKKDVEIVDYEGARHGFAVRGNPEVPREKEMGEQAERQALDFFSKYLAPKSKL